MADAFGFTYCVFCLFKDSFASSKREIRAIDGRTISHRTALVILAAALLIGVVFWYKSDVFREPDQTLAGLSAARAETLEREFYFYLLFPDSPLLLQLRHYILHYAAFKKRDLKYLVIIWLIFLVTILQIKRIRYIIMAFPMLALMASYGLQEIKDKRIIRFMSLLYSYFFNHALHFLPICLF